MRHSTATVITTVAVFFVWSTGPSAHRRRDRRRCAGAALRSGRRSPGTSPSGFGRCSPTRFGSNRWIDQSIRGILSQRTNTRQPKLPGVCAGDLESDGCGDWSRSNQATKRSCHSDLARNDSPIRIRSRHQSSPAADISATRGAEMPMPSATRRPNSSSQ